MSLKTTRKCKKCHKSLDLSFFTLNNRDCDFCMTYRKCGQCNTYKLIGKEISYKGFFCFDCVKKRRKDRADKKKKKSWVRICPDCGIEVTTTVPRATVIYCEECREHKKEIKKQAKLKIINEIKTDYCQICKRHTPNVLQKHRTIVCADCRDKMQEFKKSCYIDGKYIKTCIKCGDKYEATKERFWNPLYCKNCTHVEPYANIRIHKFGYQGLCTDGHRYTSLHEQDFDEWLLEKNIKHIPHPRLTHTYRHSDFFLPEFSKHIEIDGLDREDDIDWYGKLSIYEKLGMKKDIDFLILKPVSKHFIEDKFLCFNEFDNIVLPLLCKVL
jgi:predicted metal-binding protein